MITIGRNRISAKRIVAVALLVLLALYLVLVNFLVSAALVPSFMKKLDAFDEITKESYALQVHTSDVQENRREELRETAQWLETAERYRRSIPASDGCSLVAAEFPAEGPSHRWAVLLHGYTGWKEEMYPFALWYHRQGYHVLVPDLRAHGESEGHFIGMGWLDRQDVLLWLAGILEQDGQAEIVLHGQSMGAACALMMSGMPELPSNVTAVVSDCAFTDAYSMFCQDIRDWFHLPAFPLVDSANLALRLRGGYDLREASALRAVARSRVPTLFIHGDLDRMVPVDMGKSLYRAAACEKRLLIVEGAGHAQAQVKDPAAYYGAISDLLGVTNESS